MQRKDVLFENKRFGSVALITNVELPFELQAERFQAELHNRLRKLENMPRIEVAVRKAAGYVNNRLVYTVVLPYLDTSQLHAAYQAITGIEQEITELKREQALLGLLATN